MGDDFETTLSCLNHPLFVALKKEGRRHGSSVKAAPFH
jgi:hypothetical protein